MPDMDGTIEQSEAIQIASEIVAAYVSYNKVQADDLPNLLHDIFGAISSLAEGGRVFAGNREPAVPINKSVTPEHVICLEDGKKLKMLKRYLRTHYDLTPEEYRRKWGLPADYPMVAPNYAKRRSQFAKDIGLGTAATTKRKKASTSKTARKKLPQKGEKQPDSF